jgi:hypothetical protein
MAAVSNFSTPQVNISSNDLQALEHEWLHLRGAWVADPDGEPIQLVQRRG